MMNCMCFCRLGWSRGLCLSKGICWVLLLSWETPCTHCKGQGELISDIYCSECQGRNPVQHWTHQCQCSYVGCVPREGSYPTNCGRPCKLHGVEGWGFPGMGGRMGFSLSRGWWVKEGPFRGKKPNMNFQLRKFPHPCTQIWCFGLQNNLFPSLAENWKAERRDSNLIAIFWITSCWEFDRKYQPTEGYTNGKLLHLVVGERNGSYVRIDIFVSSRNERKGVEEIMAQSTGKV